MGARKWVIGGFLAAVLLVVGLGVYAALAKQDREQKESESDLEAAVARAEALGLPVYADHLRTNSIPDENNAWVEIKKINELIRSDEDGWWQVYDLYLEDDEESFMAQAERIVAFCDESFLLARLAARKPRYIPERQWEEGTFMLFYDMASTKRLIEALVVRSRYGLYNDEFEDAREALLIAVQIADHLASERSEIGVLVHAAITSLISHEIVRQVGTQPTVQHRHFLRSALESLYEGPDVKHRYIEEVILFVETIRMVSDQNEFANELRADVSEDDLSITGNISGMSLPASDALRFEARAIRAVCDYFEALSPEIGGYVKNDAAFAKLTAHPTDWAADGFPFGFIEMVSVTSAFERPYSLLAQDALRAEMYKVAFTVVTGSITLENGETQSAQSLPGAEFEYLNHEGGFSITATAPDLDPITLKFDRP